MSLVMEEICFEYGKQNSNEDQSCWILGYIFLLNQSFFFFFFLISVVLLWGCYFAGEIRVDSEMVLKFLNPATIRYWTWFLGFFINSSFFFSICFSIQFLLFRPTPIVLAWNISQLFSIQFGNRVLNTNINVHTRSCTLYSLFDW